MADTWRSGVRMNMRTSQSKLVMYLTLPWRVFDSKKKLLVPERPENPSVQALSVRITIRRSFRISGRASTLLRSFYEEAFQARKCGLSSARSDELCMMEEMKEVLSCCAGGADSKSADQCRVRMIRSSAASWQTSHPHLKLLKQ